MAEYDAASEADRRTFRFHREGENEDPAYWGSFVSRAYLEWLQAVGQGLPDPLAWAIPKEDHRLGAAGVARSAKDDAGSPLSLFALTRFLPEEMNDTLVLAWKRNYRPEVETVDEYMKWKPEDFSVDQVTRTHITNLGNHRVDLFRIHERIIRFQVGERVLELRPLMRLKHRFTGDNGRVIEREALFGFRNTADVLFRSCRGHVGEPAVEIDYLDPKTVSKLDRVENEDIRRRLDWGPEVWDVEGGQPVAPLPRVEPVHMDIELPPLPQDGTPPTRELLAERLHAALTHFDDAEVRRAIPLTMDAVRKTMRALNKGQPKILRLEAEELLFEPGDRRDVCWIIIAGSLEEWRHDAWVGDRGPGMMIGEDPILADLPRDTEARAQIDSVVIEIDGQVLREFMESEDWELRGVIGRLSWWAGQHQVRMALETSYQLDTTSYQCFPGAKAVVLPGPYEASNIELIYLLVQRPLDGFIERHLPPDVVWHPKLPVGILMFARFEDFGPAKIELDTGGGAAYTETGLMIPANVTGRDGKSFQIYVPWIFPSNIQAMFAGRELYGYPKTYANTVFDDEHGRVILRRRGRNQTVFHYDEVPWSQIGVRDLLHMAACFGHAGKVDWGALLRVNQDDEAWPQWSRFTADQPQGPDPDRQPITGPLMAAAGAYLNGVVPRLVPWIPEPFRKLSVACWKRNFSPSARYPTAELRAAWAREIFDVDSIAGSGFLVTGLSDIVPIRIREDEGIKMTWLPEDDLSPEDEPYEQVFHPLGGIGLRLKYDMAMTTGGTLLDFLERDDGPERDRLEFGPLARRRHRRRLKV